MFNFKIERQGSDKVLIEVWEGESLLVSQTLPMKDMGDRTIVYSCFNNADFIFRNKVLDWILHNTPIA